MKLIQDIYEGTKTKVRCSAGVTYEFQINVGIHQGSVLSPLLFIVPLDWTICLSNLQMNLKWKRISLPMTEHSPAQILYNFNEHLTVGWMSWRGMDIVSVNRESEWISYQEILIIF